MYLAENIRFLRKKQNMSQEDLADALGYKSYTTVQKWESGVSEPPLKSLKKMADLFDTDMDRMTQSRLMTDADRFERTAEIFNQHLAEKQSCDVIAIPVLRRVAAGIPLHSYENTIGYEYISKDMASKGNFFALKISGNSMSPGIMDGDTVICRQQPDAEDGNIVVALVNGDDGVCKRLRKYENNSIVLQSDNPACQSLCFNTSEIDTVPVRVMGIVVELRRRF